MRSVVVLEKRARANDIQLLVAVVRINGSDHAWS